MERHKSIAIPVTRDPDGGPPKFLVVHDRRYKEWTFVTGGCRRREVFNPLRCAIRELEEDVQRYRATVDAQLGLLPAAGESSANAEAA